MITLLFATGIFAYFCGSIPFGKIIAWRFYGVDIQKRGSGNIGFTNMLRVLGWRAGLMTLFLDILKGFLPTFLALGLFGPNAAFFVGLAAILGHVFPVWLKFHGGKGIATGLGVVAAITPLLALGGIIAYLLGCLLLKKSGLGSFVGSSFVALVGSFVYPQYMTAYLALLLIACWTLRSNLVGKHLKYDA